MIRVAITGNIASGKSEAEKYLKDKYPVIDTDELSHNILQTKKELILKEFQKFDIQENGNISRKKLGNLVFNNNELKTKLENIIHPEIEKEIKKFFEQHASSKIAFVSIPLLFEAKMEHLFDKIIMIYINDELRLERLMKRNNLTKDDAVLRINSQMAQEEKTKKSDFIIKNESDFKTLYFQLDEVINTMLVF